MNMHKIVGLNVDMGYKRETLKKQAIPYKINEDVKPDVTVYLSDSFLENKQKEAPHLNLDQHEYIWTGAVFYDALISFKGLVLHSSAVMMDGKAYLFSAASGVGKSTHTGLWLKAFPGKAEILNDDKPAIRITDNGIKVYGTPWSGKTDLNINIEADLQGICFIERDTKNHIEEISKEEAVTLILNQTLRPQSKNQMIELLDTLDTVISKTPIYKMGCTISEEAAIMAYNKMK